MRKNCRQAAVWNFSNAPKSYPCMQELSVCPVMLARTVSLYSVSERSLPAISGSPRDALSGSFRATNQSQHNSKCSLDQSGITVILGRLRRHSSTGAAEEGGALAPGQSRRPDWTAPRSSTSVGRLRVLSFGPIPSIYLTPVSSKWRWARDESSGPRYSGAVTRIKVCPLASHETAYT